MSARYPYSRREDYYPYTTVRLPIDFFDPLPAPLSPLRPVPASLALLPPYPAPLAAPLPLPLRDPVDPYLGYESWRRDYYTRYGYYPSHYDYPHRQHYSGDYEWSSALGRYVYAPLSRVPARPYYWSPYRPYYAY